MIIYGTLDIASWKVKLIICKIYLLKRQEKLGNNNFCLLNLFADLSIICI